MIGPPNQKPFKPIIGTSSTGVKLKNGGTNSGGLRHPTGSALGSAVSVRISRNDGTISGGLRHIIIGTSSTGPKLSNGGTNSGGLKHPSGIPSDNTADASFTRNGGTNSGGLRGPKKQR